MANLKTNFLGVELKNPVGVTSCEFGGHSWLAKRVCEQNIGWLIAKTCHKINGPHRWARPYFYPLRKFGPEYKDTFTSGVMFQTIPYDEFFETEGPKILKTCNENDVLYIGSCCGVGTEPENWHQLVRDWENLGVKMIELDTGGPHATFGAVEAQKDCGAPLAMDPEKAAQVIKNCVEAVKIPIIFKCTPQCTKQNEVVDAVAKAGAGAISANNSFYGGWIDAENEDFYGGRFAGGLTMGPAWQPFSLTKFLEVSSTLPNFPLIGGGGIATGMDCVRYMLAGAQLTGLCGSVYTRGVGILPECVKGISDFMDRKGYTDLEQFRGKVLPKLGELRDWPREDPFAQETPIIPKFDYDKCTKCGVCAKICFCGAIDMTDKGPELNEHCKGCSFCMGMCPAKENAITMVERDTGKFVWDGNGVYRNWLADRQ